MWLRQDQCNQLDAAQQTLSAWDVTWGDEEMGIAQNKDRWACQYMIYVYIDIPIYTHIYIYTYIYIHIYIYIHVLCPKLLNKKYRYK